MFHYEFFPIKFFPNVHFPNEFNQNQVYHTGLRSALEIWAYNQTNFVLEKLHWGKCFCKNLILAFSFS